MIVVPVNRVLPTIPLIADLTQSLPKLDIDIFIWELILQHQTLVMEVLIFQDHCAHHYPSARE